MEVCFSLPIAIKVPSIRTKLQKTIKIKLCMCNVLHTLSIRNASRFRDASKVHMRNASRVRNASKFSFHLEDKRDGQMSLHIKPLTNGGRIPPLAVRC
jgi:hypothetical protein